MVEIGVEVSVGMKNDPQYGPMVIVACGGVLIDLIVKISALVVALADSIAEIDLNPVIVNQSGCTIVDALVVPQRDEPN